MQKIIKNLPKIYISLFVILLFLFLLNNSLNYLDSDFGWHLRVGQETLENKQVPHIETFLYTLKGVKWVDHEWLSNVISYFIYNNFGYFLLNIIFTIFPILSIFILLIISKKFFTKKIPLTLSALLLSLGVLAMAPHLGVRIQEITLLFLILLVLIILQYDYKKNTKCPEGKKIFFYLPPLFMSWANLHAGFLIGFAVFGYYIFYQIILLILKKNKELKEVLILVLFFIASLVATLINPYGLELYSFLTTYSDTFYMTHISEWLPAYSYPIIYYQLFYNALYITILILVFLERKENNISKKYNFWHFTLTIIFFILAIKSRRHFPLFFIVSFPLILQFTSRDLYLKETWNNFIKKNILINFFLLISILLTIIYFISSTQIINNPFTHEKFCKSAPCKAVKFIKNNKELANLQFFNLYGWGGYLDWVWPEKQLFSDGRLPMTQFNGISLLEEYDSFFKEDESENKLNEYNIKLLLLRKFRVAHFTWFEKLFFGLDEEKFNIKNHLSEFLRNSPEWDLKYEDKISEVFARKE
ncbi:MAG: hypothetical protein ACTSUG_13585 [Candidatus Helarchaeota archaeon]